MQKSEIFDKVEDCIADFAAGKIVIVADDESRENEGDMIVAAEKITPESVNTMIKLARGLVCVPTTSERLTALGIDDMVRLNRDAKGTAFTVTVDAAKGVTTGISAADRARTIKLMATPSAGPSDFVTPGHVNPLRARPGGVLERGTHGGGCRSRKARRAIPMCSHLRNYERRRHHGAHPRPRKI